MTDQVRELASLLLKPPIKEPVTLVQAVVESYTVTHLTAYLSGGSFPVGGIRYLDSYAPHVGDVIWIVKSGPDLIAIGTLEKDAEDITRHKIETLGPVAPGGTSDTTSAYPTFAEWNGSAISVDVPEWAKTAHVYGCAAGVYGVTATVGVVLRLRLGSTSGYEMQTSADNTSMRRNYSWCDVFDVSAIAGTTVAMSMHQARNSPFSGGLRADASSDFNYQITFTNT